MHSSPLIGKLKDIQVAKVDLAPRAEARRFEEHLVVGLPAALVRLDHVVDNDVRARLRLGQRHSWARRWRHGVVCVEDGDVAPRPGGSRGWVRPTARHSWSSRSAMMRVSFRAISCSVSDVASGDASSTTITSTLTPVDVSADSIARADR